MAQLMPFPTLDSRAVFPGMSSFVAVATYALLVVMYYSAPFASNL